MDREGTLVAVRHTFVTPFHMTLLHGNFTSNLPRHSGELLSQIATAAVAITDHQLGLLLDEAEWRGRLCAGWFIGLTRRAQFVDTLGRLLLASELTYACQGYCVALALIGNQACQTHLHTYLTEYLPLRGRFYDQDWALGALAYAQGSEPTEFLGPALWAEREPEFDPRAEISYFNEVVDFLVQHQMIATSRE